MDTVLSMASVPQPVPCDPGVTAPGGLGLTPGESIFYLVFLQPLSPFQVQVNKDRGPGGNQGSPAKVGP